MDVVAPALIWEMKLTWIGRDNICRNAQLASFMNWEGLAQVFGLKSALRQSDEGCSVYPSFNFSVSLQVS